MQQLALARWRGSGQWSRGTRGGRLRWVTLAVGAVAVGASLVSVVVFNVHAGQTPMLFLTIPVALAASSFGLRAGLVAAAVAFVVTAGWYTADGHSEVGAVGWVARGVAFALVGGLVGWYADQRRRLSREIARRTELSVDLISTLGYEGTLTSVNPAWTATLGHTAEELRAVPLLEFVHPDDRMAAAEAAISVRDTGESKRAFQARLRHSDGSYRWLEVSAERDPEARHIVGVARDITERKEAEEDDRNSRREFDKTAQDLADKIAQTEELNRRLEVVTEGINDGLITINEQGLIIRFNPASQRIFGYARDEVIGKNVSMLMPNPDRTNHDTYVANYLRSREAKIIGIGRDVAGQRKDGSVFPMELSIGEAMDRGETIFIGIVRDITERKRLEQAEQEYMSILKETVDERTAVLQERTTELDEARIETLRRLARAAEYRDDDTFQHAQRVGQIAGLLGERLGLTARDVEILVQAAPLHDIGKLAVSDTILLKRGKLTPEQWQQMKRHTIIGEEILAGSVSDVLRLAATIARSHHEWWDGTGYPDGAQGEGIPLPGRIVCLADVFDSLTHERPYKKAWTVDRAVAEIHRLSGRHFDPAIVTAFQQLDPHELATYERSENTVGQSRLKTVGGPSPRRLSVKTGV